jgi:hypothetical protein
MDTPIATPLAEVKAHAGETVGRARKRLAKDTRKATKDVRKSAKRARKTVTSTAGDVIAAARPGKPKRRRWPWLVGAGMLAAGAGTAAYLARAKQRESAPALTDEVPEQHRGTPSSNGSAPQRQEHTDSPAHRN